jgi:hypothetical protein
MANPLRTLFEKGDSLGSIRFFYNGADQKYVGDIEMPDEQAFLGQVPDFLASVVAKDICLVPNEKKAATYFITIGYLKQDSDPDHFDMEIKSCPESSFNESDFLDIAPQSQ